MVFYFLISSCPIYFPMCTADKNLEIDFIITFSISLAFPLIGFNILAQLLGWVSLFLQHTLIVAIPNTSGYYSIQYECHL